MRILLNKSSLSLFIIVLINFLFVTKYAYRATEYYYLIGLGVVLIQFVIVKYFYRIKFILKKIKNWHLISLFCLIFLLISFKIPLESLKIDRWSVIDSFWDFYFQGKYVYEAKSFDNNYPGPMPFYFIIMLPFYLIGEYSLITIIALIVFYKLMENIKLDKNIILLILLICFTSVFFIYEILARSNIFFNSTLVIFTLIFLLKTSNNTKNILLKGIIIGLCLSTRNVYIIAFAISFLYLLLKEKEKLIKLLSVGLIAILTFCLTFVPFVYTFFDKFLIINPFIIQSSFLMPTELSFLCILISLFLVYFVKNKDDVFFYSGLMLFVTILVYYIYIISQSNFTKAFFESKADITYFIFCVPFFLYYLSRNEKTILNTSLKFPL